MRVLRICSLAAIVLSGVGAASAATIQDSRGTFIQDHNGVWNEYVRVQPNRMLMDPYETASPILNPDIAKGEGW